MNNNRDRVLSYTEEFSKKYGYTPTTFQISNELYIPHDKVSSIIEALEPEGAIQISGRYHKHLEFVFLESGKP